MSAFTKGCAVAAVASAVCLAPHKKEPPRLSVCTPQPVLRSDGTTGRFNVVTPGQEKHDPLYKDAVPANYAENKGLTCDELPGYFFSGVLVGSDGTVTGGDGDVYPLWLLVRG